MQDEVDPAALIVAHVPLGLSLIAMGNPIEARVQLEQATRTYRDLKGGQIALRYGMEVGAVGYAYEAWCLGMLGYPERAFQGRAATLEIIERVRHPYTSARGLYWCAVISAIHGEWRATFEFADRAIKAADEHDFAMAGAVAHVMRGAARAALEPSAQAIVEMREGLDFNRRAGARTQLPFMLTLFAEALLATKDLDAGLLALQEASDVAEETSEQHVAAEIHRIRGNLKFESGTGDPEADYLLALQAARLQGARLFELRASHGLAQLQRGQGRIPEARKPTRRGLRRVHRRVRHALSQKRKGAARQPRLISSQAANQGDGADLRFRRINVNSCGSRERPLTTPQTRRIDPAYDETITHLILEMDFRA